MLQLVFLIAALVLFILAAVGVAHPRVNLEAAGLACLAASMLSTKYGV
jgi:hypothetical protein